MTKTYGKQVGPNSFVLTMESGPFKMDNIARYSNNHGVKTLSSPYGQSIQADGDIWACAITTILLLIATLWSVVVIIVSLIRLIIKKIKKSEKVQDAFKKYEIILCSSVLLLVFNIISVANKMFASAPYSALIINVIVSIILGILPIAYAVQLQRKWSNLTSGKLQKLSYIITMCMEFVMTLTVIVLEMYKQ